MQLTMRRTAPAVILAAALALSACASANQTPAETPPDTPAMTEAAYPRTIEHDAGTTEIPTQPTRVLATSLSIAGTLLALDAPVVASAATTPGPLTDDKGFFIQWAEIADERGIEVAYPNFEIDMESIESFAPDLIVGSTTGADATLDQYAQLEEIAPTVLFDYGTVAWQDLAERLGEVLGLEENADALVADYDTYVADTANGLKLPEQPITVAVYNGANGLNVFSADSPQVGVFESLGFEHAPVPTDLAATTRGDVAGFTAENMDAALADTGTLFLVGLAGDPLDAFLADPLVANTSVVQNKAVKVLPASSFRMDYYSSTILVDLINEFYGS